MWKAKKGSMEGLAAAWCGYKKSARGGFEGKRDLGARGVSSKKEEHG
jgi:hypothetical protein